MEEREKKITKYLNLASLCFYVAAVFWFADGKYLLGALSTAAGAGFLSHAVARKKKAENNK